MTKKLKIRFVKFECALVAQQLAVAGREFFDETEHVKLDGSFYLCKCLLSLINSATDERVNINAIYFSNNAERDEYLNNVIKWISEEQFATGGKLKIGKPCMVSLFEGLEKEDWEISRLLAILPRPIENRYITQSEASKRMFAAWPCARPIGSCVQPKIDGDIYTWEMEVAE